VTTFLKADQILRAGARTLPGRYFTSPEIFERESLRIFQRGWLCVGRELELASPGDFIVVNVGVESVIVVRDRGGALRAHFNVCRHRGTRICEAERGTFAGTIQCPYHAWTYGLDGALVGAPHTKEIEGFDKSEHGLLPAGVDVWEGFVFINPAEDRDPLASSFAPIAERFERFNLRALRPARRIEYSVRANWKLLFQNYSECLHCPVIHPALAKLSPYDSGANDLVEGSFLGGFMTITREGGSMSLSGAACGIPVGELPAEDQHRVYYYSIFPNMLLSLHPDYAMYHMLWPQGPGETRVQCEWLFHPDTFGDARFDPQDAVAFWDMTNKQDWHVCEISQLGVASSRYVPGLYSPREGILAAWDEEYLRRLGDGHAAEGRSA
jgi:Rieske 2Fe-2S family protein